MFATPINQKNRTVSLADIEGATITIAMSSTAKTFSYMAIRRGDRLVDDAESFIAHMSGMEESPPVNPPPPLKTKPRRRLSIGSQTMLVHRHLRFFDAAELPWRVQMNRDEKLIHDLRASERLTPELEQRSLNPEKERGK